LASKVEKWSISGIQMKQFLVSKTRNDAFPEFKKREMKHFGIQKLEMKQFLVLKSEIKQF
jgi:hypothetical protein